MDTEAAPAPDMTYTKELRKATKDVHKMSDLLVNAKFALALNDDTVWADGLLAFYEIYKYFEEHLPEELLPKELYRAPSFEKDLTFFYGKDWKNYEIRDSVKKYISHLDEVRAKGDIYLFAYAFQMYMALMSGGQLLQKKRMLARKLFGKTEEIEEEFVPIDDNTDPDDLEQRPMPKQVTICPDGCAATYFPEKITDLKAKLRTIMNNHYGKFDEQQRADFIKESRMVFTLNGEVVRSIKGVTKASLRIVSSAIVVLLAIYFGVKLLRNNL